MSSMRAVLFHGYRRTLVTYNVRMCDKREVCIMKKKTDWVSISNWAGQKKVSALQSVLSRDQSVSA